MKEKLFLCSYKRVGQEVEMGYWGKKTNIALVIFSGRKEGEISIVAVRGSEIVYEAFRVDEDMLVGALDFLGAKICRK
jgi:hypothetical protein